MNFLLRAAAILALLFVSPLASAAGFAVGNPVVVRVGHGADALSANGNAVFLDEFTPTGILVQSVALPVTASGAHRPFALDGTAVGEGLLTRSSDGRYLVLTGYGAAPGAVAALAATSAATVPRVVARVDGAARIDTTTALTDYASGGSPRAATSVDGSAFWMVGSTGGVRMAAAGATTSTEISPAAGELRAIEVCVGQLYVSSGAGTLRIGTVGTGIPTTGGQPIAPLPGFPATGSPFSFFLLDQNAAVAGSDTLYVADDGGTIRKYSLVSGAWAASGTVAAPGVRGLTATLNGATVNLYGTSSTTLYHFADHTGYNGSIAGNASVLATAPPNTVWRGAAIAPAAAPIITTHPLAQTVNPGAAASFSVVAAGNEPFTYRWRRNGANLADAAGAIAGAATDTLTLTNVSAATAGSYDVVVTNAINTVTSNAAGLTVAAIPATVTLSGLMQTYTGAPIAVTAATAPAGLAVTLTYNGSTVAPTNPGAYTVVATVNDPVYTGTASGTLTIAPRPVATLSLGNLQQVYTGTPRPVSVSTNPAGTSVSISYNGSPAPPINVGTYTVIATASDGTSGTAIGTLTITKATPTVGIEPVTAFIGSPVTLHANSSSGLPVSLVLVSGNATLTGTTLVAHDPGPVVVRGSQAGDANNNPSTTEITLTAIKREQTIAFAPPASLLSTAAPLALAATASSGLPVTLELVSGPAVLGGSLLRLTGHTGNVVVRATQAGDAAFHAASPVERTITVTLGAGAPAIVQSPEAQAVLVGGSATLAVTASGNPEPTYQWRKDGRPLPGGTDRQLTLASVSDSDAGGYDVVATNTHGSATSAIARVRVVASIEPPTILRQPANQTALVGQSVTLSVGATGVPAPSYQWSREGQAISGATQASFTIDPVTVVHAGRYSVVVTNSSGNRTSASALLNVIRRSFAGTYFGTTGAGGSFALHVNADHRGTFLAFVPALRVAYLSRAVSVNDTGQFRLVASTLGTPTVQPAEGPPEAPAAADAANDLTIAGTIAENGTLSGTSIAGAAFALNGAKSTATAIAVLPGLYQASAANVTSQFLGIVSAGGQAVVITRTADGIDGGTGMLDDSGRLSIATGTQQAIVASFTPRGAVTSTLTSVGGRAVTMTGFAQHTAGEAAQRMVNLSTRTSVGIGEQAAVVGFVITGLESKTVLVRAIGPGLRDFGVPTALTAPRLDLVQVGSTATLATNIGWTTAPNRGEIATAAAASGAFPLASTSADSVILATLPPGAYTAIVSAFDARAGVGLVEVYDLSSASALQRLANLSIRAATGAGDSLLIAGVVIGGDAPKRVLIRAAGPALAQFGLTGVLARPHLSVFAGPTVLATNSGWAASPDAPAIAEAAADAGAFGFGAGSADAALLVNLAPGAYTAQVSGAGGASGLTLVEIYELP